MAVTMVEYKWGDIILVMPKLHRVYYNKKENTFLVRDWCNNFCKNAFYFTTYDDCIEFEDDEDATLFALKWT